MAKDNLDTNNLAKAAFNDALNQVKTEKKFDKDTTIEDLIQQFESVSQTDESGVEFWYARDLQELLEYTDYRNFINTIAKAKDACELAGSRVKTISLTSTKWLILALGLQEKLKTY